MNFREKFVVQSVICLLIFSAVKTTTMIDVEMMKNLKSWTEEKVTEHYSAEDLKKAAISFFGKAGEAQDIVTSVVIQANEKGRIMQPLGEADSGGIHAVYAPSGGEVVIAGISDEIGLYVKIKHDEQISVCGNLSELAVLTGERVRKGDIIGTFDSNGSADFVYELSDL